MFKCISPLFYVSKIFGLSPFTVPPNKSSTYTRAFDYLMFVFTESVFVCLMYFNIAEYIEVADSSSVIFALCQDFSFFLNNIFAIIAIFLITIYRHQIHKMLVLLNDCDRKLLLVGAKINYKRHFQFTLIFVAISY